MTRNLLYAGLVGRTARGYRCIMQLLRRWQSAIRPGLVCMVPLAAWAAPVPVHIETAPDGRFALMREGKPLYVKGAGGNRHLDVLQSIGGNSIRTWGVEELRATVDGKPLLDRAQELGLTVAVGLWVAHPRHGFDYGNTAAVAAQREQILAAVREYKDHPAVLLWGVGNEMEGQTAAAGDPRVWEEVNTLAGLVKAEDPHHPVMTVIAGAGEAKLQSAVRFCTNLDLLGVNAYGGATGVGAALKRAGWKKPYLLTEFGLPGFWEAPKTPWGAPIEPASQQKASSYYATQSRVAEENAGFCLGTYAFLWGQKQECTATWFGMFLESGEKLPQVDALAYAWNKTWPSNRCPKIVRLTTSLTDARCAPGAAFSAEADATDANGDALRYEWAVVAESKERGVGGDAEARPPAFPSAVLEQGKPAVKIQAPAAPGGYRLFLTVRDGRGAASCDNVPFLVGGTP